MPVNDRKATSEKQPAAKAPAASPVDRAQAAQADVPAAVMGHQPYPASPQDVLALQRTIGNRAVGRQIAGQAAGPRPATPAIQPYRDFVGARGTPTYDYKLVNGVDPTYGNYHIKFHNFQSLGVFDEIHVVFERYASNPKGYFFYTDQGAIIAHKSSGLDIRNDALTDLAQQIVDAQLSTSSTVSNQDVQEMLARKQEEEARQKQQQEIWAQERQQKELAERGSKIQAEVDRLGREYPLAAQLHAKGLLQPIVESGVPWMAFSKFGIKDPIKKWLPELQVLSGPILEVAHGIDLNARVSNAPALNGLQRGHLIQILLAKKDNKDLNLPENIFTAGPNPVLSYDDDDQAYDIFYDL
jgi:hypothetical protein